MRNVIITVIVAGAVAGYFGYTRVLREKQGTGSLAASAPRADGVAAKLDAYIACMNRFSDRAFESRSYYLAWADADKGPAGAEQPGGLYSMHDPKPCVDGIAGAKAIEPRNAELEAAGDAYGQALTALVPVLKEADDYYTQKNFKDDKFAKGQALHPRLMAAWDAFAAADAKLRGMVAVMNRAERERKLAELEKKEGRSLVVVTERMMLEAETLMSTIESGDLAKTDAALLTQRLEVFEKALLDLDAYATQHADEIRASSSASMVISGAKSYVTAAKELMRRLRDKVPYSSGDKLQLGTQTEWVVSGSPAKMLKNYNDLVALANRQ